jgi:hypothetical protein
MFGMRHKPAGVVAADSDAPAIAISVIRVQALGMGQSV